MGKKRKASGRPFGEKEGKDPKRDENSKLAINTYEDVADSEDEFHIGQDKILLDESPAHKRLRRAQEEEVLLEPSDEEVLPASDVDESSEAEDDESSDDYQEVEVPSSRAPKSKSLPKALQRSDSEESEADKGEDDFTDWGSSRKDYYNADEIENGQDALEEEAEARRLQQKQLSRMTEADFGYDEIDWQESKGDEDLDRTAKGRVILEELPKLEITDDMGEEQKMTILKTRYPEFEPLAQEFVNLQGPYEELQRQVTKDEKTKRMIRDPPGDKSEQPMSALVIKVRALGAYLSAVAVYFALLTSQAEPSGGKATAMPPDQLQNHSIMDTLVQCRDLWERTKDLEGPELPQPTSVFDGSDDLVLHDKHTISNGHQDPSQPEEKPKKRKTRKSVTQRTAERQQAEAEARRQARIKETQESLADLSTLTAPSKPSSVLKGSKRESNRISYDSDSDIGDQTSLTPAEAAEKAKRKKTLRFYTSQIAQKSQKRDHASHDAGGDADLPYRERFRDRKERLTAEAEKRGRKDKGNPISEELDGEESGDNDAATTKTGDADADADEDYYDFIAANSKKKKAEKAARAEAAAAIANGAAVERVLEDMNLGPDGKRAISYAIEKNKGLTPKRKKEVRNPRVKKRNRYEDKMKKLSSTRPVYKGPPKGGYGGELTGIKTGLSKGVKL